MVKKLTTEEFIAKAKTKHGDKYDYSKVNYVGNKIKIKIICSKHGEFEQTPDKHINIGRGCKKCPSLNKIKIKTDNFIKKANKVHKNKYDYTKTTYINNKTKIKIICLKHGEFEQTPSMHVNSNSGCHKCGQEKCANSKRKTQKEFISQATKKHNNKYDYSKIVYKSGKNKIIIVCPEHGEFEQVASSHLLGCGCPKCGNVSASKKMSKGRDKFIMDANNKYNNRYDYSKIIYKNVDTKIKIICKDHGIFEQTPYVHMKSVNGCPECSCVKKLSNEIIIKKGNLIHENKYDYSMINYKNVNSKIIILCPDHGQFKQTPNKHLNANQGCPKCVGKNKDYFQFVKQANKIHNSTYEYLPFTYKNNKQKIKIICRIHNEFTQRISDHLTGCGCPKCSNNGTSKIAQEWIDLLLIKQPELEHFYHKKGEYKISKTNYYADGYDEKTKTIYEFHGDFWHGNPDVFNHKLMNDVCKKTFGQLYKRTMKKQKECENLGYTYKSIWENDWIKGKMALKRIQNNFRKKQMLKKFPYQCEKCNYKCKFKSEYDRHCNSVLHKTGKRGVKKNKVNRVCQICKLYEASCNTNLKNHILINHKTAEEREKEYPNYCKTCDYGSFSKKLFDKHLTTKKHKKKEEMIKKLKDIN